MSCNNLNYNFQCFDVIFNVSFPERTNPDSLREYKVFAYHITFCIPDNVLQCRIRVAETLFNVRENILCHIWIPEMIFNVLGTLLNVFWKPYLTIPETMFNVSWTHHLTFSGNIIQRFLKPLFKVLVPETLSSVS